VLVRCAFVITGGKLCQHTLRGHTLPVTSITFSAAQPQLLCSGSYDGTVRIWDLRSPQNALHVVSVEAEGGKVLCTAWQAGILYAGTDQGKLALFDAKSMDYSQPASN
jgi:ribosome biogenesis protein YTM1